MDSQVPPVKTTSALWPFWWLAILFGSIATLVILWFTRIPLGVPGEWIWDRPVPESDLPWNLVGGGIAASLFTAFILQGWRRLETLSVKSKPRLEIVGWLALLVIFSFGWLWIVEEMAPLKCRLGKAAFVLFYPSSSGYFTRARYDSPDSATFLAGYEELMREGDVLHTGTHPPGLFLVFHGLIAACKSSEQLSAFLDATQPTSFQEACEMISSNNLRLRDERKFLSQDRRVLWLATLLVMLATSLTVVPLFGLLCRNIPIPTAWLCASLWPAIPAAVVFIPKSDVVFPFLGVTLMWVWLLAWARRSLILSFLAGLLAWCGLICSLAFLPVLLATALLTFGGVWWGANPSGDQSQEKNGFEPVRMLGAMRWFCLFVGVVGFGLPTLALLQLLNANLLKIWWLNYQNHAGFYLQFSRTYWKWVLVNPAELCFSVGFPIALSGFVACARIVYQILRKGTSALRCEQGIIVASIAFVWGLLWLTGKNSSEAARLWIVFMPWMIWLASFQIDLMLRMAQGPRSRFRQALALIVIQYAICLLTVARVSGFHNDVG